MTAFLAGCDAYRVYQYDINLTLENHGQYDAAGYIGLYLSDFNTGKLMTDSFIVAEIPAFSSIQNAFTVYFTASAMIDAPETTGLFDRSTGDLFSSDSFGAVMQQPADSAADYTASDLREGMHLWASVDAPWLKVTDQQRFVASVQVLRSLKPRRILSSHLAEASGATRDALFSNLEDVTGMQGFVGPDQVALEQMMASA